MAKHFADQVGMGAPLVFSKVVTHPWARKIALASASLWMIALLVPTYAFDGKVGPAGFGVYLIFFGPMGFGFGEGSNDGWFGNPLLLVAILSLFRRQVAGLWITLPAVLLAGSALHRQYIPSDGPGAYGTPWLGAYIWFASFLPPLALSIVATFRRTATKSTPVASPSPLMNEENDDHITL